MELETSVTKRLINFLLKGNTKMRLTEMVLAKAERGKRSEEELECQKIGLKTWLISSAKNLPLPPKNLFENTLAEFLSINGLLEEVRSRVIPLINRVTSTDVVRCEVMIEPDKTIYYFVKNLAGETLHMDKSNKPNTRMSNFGFFACKIVTLDKVELYAADDRSRGPTEEREQEHWILFDKE